MGMSGLLHFHSRKRIEPYPARSWSMRVLDKSVYAAGILGPLSTIPQMYVIFATHNATSVSISTWAIAAFFDIPWIFYAIAHKARPLILCYVLWFIFNSAVVLGVLLYGNPMHFYGLF
jgi:uncharacterized protein with PQ loop repeat